MFAPRSDYVTGLSPYAVVVGDLNGDGRPDLATANCAAATVSVLLGHGDGTFGAKADFGTGTNPVSVAIGDLNGDGKPDLAVANSEPNTVLVLLNTGTVPWVGVDPPPAPARGAWLSLAPPWPNPTREATRLRFFLPAAAVVNAEVFDAAGNRVKSLGPGAALPPGEHTLLWDGRDGGGRLVAAGLYIVRIKAGQDIATGKLVRLK